MTQRRGLADWLDGLSHADARNALTSCCAATAWVDGMVSRRPFEDDAELLEAASQVWRQLTVDDWMEAFAAHPAIGDAKCAPALPAEATRLAAGEQAGVAGASRTILDELAKLNGKYREKFGFIFLVCATGKSAAEMLALLRARLENSRDEELNCAAQEQLKITLLRLAMLADDRGAS